MKAGFIGLGTMGASMAANLQRGFQRDGNSVLVHDVRREAAAPHIKNGAMWVDSPAAIAAECDIIFTSLPGRVRRGHVW
jgi:3-hydroxyisobutyrate dehydrogenase-like beta-hydroxyacid dehydrogenase